MTWCGGSQHLLQLLTSQHASICANEQIQNVAVVMDKLPHYIRKVQAIKAAMAEIAASVEKMKKRGESLRVDAQSRTCAMDGNRELGAYAQVVHLTRVSVFPPRCNQEGDEAGLDGAMEQAPRCEELRPSSVMWCWSSCRGPRLAQGGASAVGRNQPVLLPSSIHTLMVVM